ncbi:hypothetical protein PV10_06321 [Exophiala mesophila]|uniref:Alpha/beta hydrolase fold-3 domain-containing protein n=1 Tax=Exophiala mesophila TaxID=212818 RepID=A0A0D1ZD00_EXOME|nr:uncharacterized protein PV10_06321 [Exophiala mesophila]KIV91824.1 hypothetical protein PV10_06321 [Exophiala mesophila]
MASPSAYYMRNQALKAAMRSPNPPPLAPTREVVASHCQNLGIPVTYEELPDCEGAGIHWIGDRSPKTVMLYIHGGGLQLPALPGHVEFAVQTQRLMNSEGKSFALAFLEYGLTPQHKYPVQQIHAINAVNYLLSSGREASEIVIAGDSAGGALAISILAASLHQFPGVPSLELTSPLKGVILICPMVTFSTSAPSYKRNADNDWVIPEAGAAFVDALAAPPAGSMLSEPLRGAAKDWAGAPVKSILSLAGGYECFLDDIEAFVKVLEEAGLNVKKVVCPEQGHIECILDAQTKLEPRSMTTAIWDWLRETL